MKRPLRINQFRAQALALAALFIQGCGIVTTGSTDSSCSAGTAQIQVTETAMRRMCGCAEGSGTFGTGQNFNCTITLGDKIVFMYSLSNPNITHRIVFNGFLTPSFPTRTANGSTAVDQHQWGSTGSYTFTDTGVGTGGTLIVQ